MSDNPASEPPVAPRQRRRKRRPAVRTIDRTVPSPCVAVCAFDGEPFCRGCLRNADEIRNWMIMDRQEKLVVLENIRRRKVDGIS